MIGASIIPSQATPAPLAQAAGLGLNLAEIRQWAEVFVASGMFKDSRDVAKAIVKIQAGQELGLPPFAAMRGFDVIEGKPAPNAGLTCALVRRSGRYDYRVTRSDATACVIEWTDGGRVIGESSFTLEEAKAAGLASKQVWRAYASDMLFARALTRGARRFCADVFLGSVYTPEELGDDTLPDAERANGAQPAEFAVPEPPPVEFLPPPVDDEPAAPAVDWSALIDAATTAGEVARIWNRIGAELAEDPYHQGGAYRLAALRFAALIPDSIRVDLIEPTIAKLALFRDTLQAATVATRQREAHDAAIATVEAAIARLDALLPREDAPEAATLPLDGMPDIAWGGAA